MRLHIKSHILENEPSSKINEKWKSKKTRYNIHLDQYHRTRVVWYRIKQRFLTCRHQILTVNIRGLEILIAQSLFCQQSENLTLPPGLIITFNTRITQNNNNMVCWLNSTSAGEWNDMNSLFIDGFNHIHNNI